MTGNTGASGDGIANSGSTFNLYNSIVIGNTGGLTQTHALVAIRPAIDAGSNSYLSEATVDVDLNGDGDTSDTLTTDQRGPTRPVDSDGDTTSTTDVGAFEDQDTTGGIG